MVYRFETEGIKYCKYMFYMNFVVFYFRLKDFKFEIFNSNKNEENFYVNLEILKKVMNNKFR